MNLSKLYGKNINPSCSYCLYSISSEEGLQCDRGNRAAPNGSCGQFRYEPTLREPKEAPLPGGFKPEDFML